MTHVKVETKHPAAFVTKRIRSKSTSNSKATTTAYAGRFIFLTEGTLTYSSHLILGSVSVCHHDLRLVPLALLARGGDK